MNILKSIKAFFDSKKPGEETVTYSHGPNVPFAKAVTLSDEHGYSVQLWRGTATVYHHGRIIDSTSAEQFYEVVKAFRKDTDGWQAFANGVSFGGTEHFFVKEGQLAKAIKDRPDPIPEAKPYSGR